MAAKDRIYFFIGSFILTLILIAGLCGFIAVGLSMDRYMPGEFSPIFLVTDLSHEGIGLCFMGEQYRIDADLAQEAGELARRLWGLVPRSARVAGGLAQYALGP